jgi:activator of 2-hydroxyglutaryl-CoA dehydratase
VISKQCSVFAESEVITLVNNNEKISDIAAGIHDSIARRIYSMVYKVGIIEDIVLTGGCARNQALIRSLEQQLKSKISRLDENPQIAGALGAALFAKDRAICPN